MIESIYAWNEFESLLCSKTETNVKRYLLLGMGILGKSAVKGKLRFVVKIHVYTCCMSHFVI